jgi:hypothetical protein
MLSFSTQIPQKKEFAAALSDLYKDYEHQKNHPTRVATNTWLGSLVTTLQFCTSCQINLTKRYPSFVKPRH